MRIATRGLALGIGLAATAPIAFAQGTSSIPSTTSVHSTVSAESTATPECVEGVYVIVARGSEEDVGQGEMAVVAEGVEDAIDDSEAVALDYPATFQAYGRSVADGVEALNDTLVRYVEECPDGKVALMGFSQVSPRLPHDPDGDLREREEEYRGRDELFSAVSTSGNAMRC